MAFRLQTLLDLKIRAEEQAEEAVSAAIAERVRAEKRQETLEEAVAEARRKLAEALAEAAKDTGEADEHLARERFRKRLRAEIDRRKAEAQAHRDGPLADCHSAEAEARAKHLGFRQEREALDKFKEKEAAKERLIAERRTEDALGDLAIAALARKKS
jgi:flagellar biosynthesis chaperone FliJ